MVYTTNIYKKFTITDLIVKKLKNGGMGEGGGDPPKSEISDIIVLPMATGIY